MITVDLHTIPEIVDRSIYSARMKAQYQRTPNTWQQRTNFEKFSDLFSGDLAQNIVDSYLTTTFGLEIVNYDRIRTDGFAQLDRFDLMIGLAVIEVKSSIEKTLTNPNALSNRRRIVVYADAGRIRDFHFQVYYVAANGDTTFCRDWEGRASDFRQKYHVQTEEGLARLFCDTIRSAHIAGFADRLLAEQYLREGRIYRYQGDRGRETQRAYLDLLICNSYAPEEFATILKERFPNV
jgi:hypothetical protein